MIKIQHGSVEVLDAYGRHLKNLTPEDRYTRFCYNIRDEAIDQFILKILYNQQDHHLFTAKDKNVPVGFGHLAKEGADWELAVSVDCRAQGSGVANKLMNYIISWAQTHGVYNVFMHCIAQNQKIRYLANKYGLRTVERDGTEITSKMELPRPTAIDYTSEFLNEQRELYQQIQTLQQQMVQNLNPFIFIKEHNLDQ